MARYIHQLSMWPTFGWDHKTLVPLLAAIRHRQGKLLGRMEALGFGLQQEATLQNLALDVIKSSEIEGETLDDDQVKSSIARRLGIDIAGMVPTDRYVDGVVEMMMDASQHYEQALNQQRLFAWQAALFPTGRSGMHAIITGAWRENTKDNPMQVVSGAMGKEKVHFEAPEAERLPMEMAKFLEWFNEDNAMDPVLKAAIAHLWFVTIHPFDDGNGRIARAITDLQLTRADGSRQRFYSMSAQVRKERKTYYDILETTQKGSLDITGWIEWFMACLDRALAATEETLGLIMQKGKFWELHSKTIFNSRQVLMINKMLDGFEGKLNSSKWARITKSSQDTALRDIQDLINKSVLAKEPGAGRSTSYELIIDTSSKV